MRQIIIAIFLLFSLNLSILAQDEFKIGTWRAHLPYHRCNFVAYLPPYVYGAGFSGIFSWHLEDKTIERYNKLNVLSDIGISAMRVHRPSGTLLIGYESGMIDLFKNGSVRSIPDIAQADIVSGKKIRRIKPHGDSIFVVTPYGASIISFSGRAILTTINLQTPTQYININDVTLSSDSIYLATDRGVFSAPRIGINHMDYNNWTKLLSLPDPSGNHILCEFWGDTLWVGQSIEGYQNDRLVLYRNGNYRLFSLPTHGADLRQLYADMNMLQLTTNNYIYWFDQSNVKIGGEYYGGTLWQGANDAIATNAWDYFLADPFNGIKRKVKWTTGEEIVTPNGPDTYKAYHVNIAEDEVWVSAGSPGEPWSQYGIYRFKGNQWTNFTPTNVDSLQEIGNISLSITNPKNPKHIIAGSYGFGIVEFLNDEVVQKWNIFNSPLESVEGYGQGYNRITGMTFDQNRNLWIAQWYTNNPLVVKKSDGEWLSFNLESQISRQRTGEMISTPWGDIWLLMPGTGIVVFNPVKLLNNQPNAYRVFPLRRSDGSVFNDVAAIAIDHDETIWIGAKTGGIFVYYNPRSALSRDLVASQLIIEVDDHAEYLLGTESITDITVDGGNRKWIATAGGGAFLLNRGGNKQILNLNTKNSPLLSNEIYSIDINKKTGEVFFATSLGVVSYVGSATIGNQSLKEIDVYPNPVREDFNSSLIIRGLMEETTIKITDLSGRLVFE
ncbi:MAG TPA: hypothetical protein PK990_08355, partial [Salinivirgaceae bacterium]|nr:hypothetical protein [Salinivirgaceae bacterium]